MQQRITHGAVIDAATPDEVSRAIVTALDNQSVDEFTRKKGIVALDAAGNGRTTLAVPSQYDWLCDRITLTGANALVLIYENQDNGTDLLFVAQIGAAGVYSDAFSNSLYVTANSQLLLVVTGGTPGGQVTFNIQVRMKHRRQPRSRTAQ